MAQTIHKFKLFLEKTADVTGIEKVNISPEYDTGQTTVENSVLNELNQNTDLIDSPFVYDAQIHKEKEIPLSESNLHDQPITVNSGQFKTVQSNAPRFVQGNAQKRCYQYKCKSD